MKELLFFPPHVIIETYSNKDLLFIVLVFLPSVCSVIHLCVVCE